MSDLYIWCIIGATTWINIFFFLTEWLLSFSFFCEEIQGEKYLKLEYTSNVLASGLYCSIIEAGCRLSAVLSLVCVVLGAAEEGCYFAASAYIERVSPPVLSLLCWLQISFIFDWNYLGEYLGPFHVFKPRPLLDGIHYLITTQKLWNQHSLSPQ